MIEQEYQQLREECKQLNNRRSVMTEVEKESLKLMKKRRDTAKLLRDRIFFWEGRIKHYTFIRGNCKELNDKTHVYDARIISSQAALETARENFKNF